MIEENFIEALYPFEYTKDSFLNDRDIAFKFLELKNLFKKTDPLSSKLLELESNFKNSLNTLDIKLESTLEEVKNAIVSTRETTGYIYTTNIPLNKNYLSKNNTSVVKDEIVYGKADLSNNEDIVGLNRNRLTFINQNNCKINKQDKLENFILTSSNNIITFEINVQNINEYSTAFILDLVQHKVLEIKIDNILTIFKSLKKEVIIPLSGTEKVIQVRIFNSDKEQIYINKIAVSNLLYYKNTIYESKPITINKNLSHIVIDTCDNTGNENIEIKYQVKINDLNYEAFNLNKNKIVNLQNLILTDKKIVFNSFTGVKKNDGDIRFYLGINDNGREITYFVKNNKQIVNKKLYLTVNEDLNFKRSQLVLNNLDKIFIDNLEVTGEVIELYKGIRELVVIRNNIIQPINYSFLKTIISTIYISKNTKTTLRDDTGFYISLGEYDLKEGFDIFEGNAYSVDIKEKAGNIPVETIQVRAELESKDTKTVPYITRILIRGL